MVQQVVGELVEQGVGVELEPPLRAVPPRVREPSCHVVARYRRRPGDVRCRRHRRLVSWDTCGCRAPSPSSTSPGSPTTRPPSATTPPAGSSARSAARPRDRVRARRADRQVARRRLHDRGRRAADGDRVRRSSSSAGPPRSARRCRCGSASPPATRCCSRATTTSARPSTWRPGCATTPAELRVLMPTMQLERLPEGVTAEPYGEVELRGFPGPIDVVELTRHPRPRSATTPASSGPAPVRLIMSAVAQSR